MKLSRMMFTMDSKAFLVSAVNIIDRISPEIICKTKVNPSMNPIFHSIEIDEGAGKSNKDFFVKFIIGLIFISCIFILERRR